MPTTSDAAAILVARAWLEDGDVERLRVRLTATLHESGGTPRTVVVASVEEACAEFRQWLETLVDVARKRP
jgi:hypothetical protein